MKQILIDEELLEQVLEFVEYHDRYWSGNGEHPQTIVTSLRAALEQPGVEHAGKVFHAKFNIGEHVWLMKNNKPIEVVISAIEVFYVNTNQDRITYNAKDVVNSVSWLDHTKLQETLLFRSKVELLEAL